MKHKGYDSTLRVTDGEVRGVVRLENGTPAASASVVVTAGPAAIPDMAYLTDARGTFRIAGLQSGHWRIRAHAFDGLVGDASIQVPTGGVANVTITLR